MSWRSARRSVTNSAAMANAGAEIACSAGHHSQVALSAMRPDIETEAMTIGASNPCGHEDCERGDDHGPWPPDRAASQQRDDRRQNDEQRTEMPEPRHAADQQHREDSPTRTRTPDVARCLGWSHDPGHGAHSRGKDEQHADDREDRERLLESQHRVAKQAVHRARGGLVVDPSVLLSRARARRV